jgi:hypothetical protein
MQQFVARHASAIAALTVALAAIAPAAAEGQRVGPRRPEFGVVVGLNRANIVGSEDDGDPRNGLAIGATVVLPLGAGLALQPELHFVQKGSRIDDVGVDGNIGVRVNYVEAPLLLRYTAPVPGPVKPYLIGGPFAAYRTSCRITSEIASLNCDADILRDNEFRVRDLDYGAAVGAGIDFPLGPLTGTASLRFTRGFRDLIADERTRNQTIQLLAGVRF